MKKINDYMQEQKAKKQGHPKTNNYMLDETNP